ncbi:glutamic acid-rich protein-like [Aphis gossypii]|uniref:glutamic acid-rich protein-like n=1 Tax=Aphis gossypii TaxID=80765 RepID=UPI002159217A|nr:glutamic acid-rich protein-like [Aphis gossypii]
MSTVEQQRPTQGSMDLRSDNGTHFTAKSLVTIIVVSTKIVGALRVHYTPALFERVLYLHLIYYFKSCRLSGLDSPCQCSSTGSGRKAALKQIRKMENSMIPNKRSRSAEPEYKELSDEGDEDTLDLLDLFRCQQVCRQMDLRQGEQNPFMKYFWPTEDDEEEDEVEENEEDEEENEEDEEEKDEDDEEEEEEDGDEEQEEQDDDEEDEDEEEQDDDENEEEEEEEDEEEKVYGLPINDQ